MKTNTHTHDTHIFSRMVEILVSSGLGEREYGFTKTHHQTRLEEVATVMNQLGFSNRSGNPLNRNALKQVVHRIRQKDDLIDDFKPEWSWFDSPIDRSDNDSPSEDSTSCLVCGEEVKTPERELCSPICENQYRVIRYGEYISEKNH